MIYKNIFKKIVNPKNTDIVLIVEMSGNHNQSLDRALETLE